MPHIHSHNTPSVNKLERFGFWLSLVCAIHCLAMPLIITLLPFIGSTFLANHTTELWVLGSSWTLAGLLLLKDFRKHSKVLPLFLLGMSIVSKMIEVLVLGESSEKFMAPLGGILIAIAYYFNWKYNAACKCETGH